MRWSVVEDIAFGGKDIAVYNVFMWKGSLVVKNENFKSKYYILLIMKEN